MIKWLVFYITGLFLYNHFHSTHPALAILIVAAWVLLPLLPLSLEIAMTEDRRVREQRYLCRTMF